MRVAKLYIELTDFISKEKETKKRFADRLQRFASFYIKYSCY